MDTVLVEKLAEQRDDSGDHESPRLEERADVTDELVDRLHMVEEPFFFSSTCVVVVRTVSSPQGVPSPADGFHVEQRKDD